MMNGGDFPIHIVALNLHCKGIIETISVLLNLRFGCPHREPLLVLCHRNRENQNAYLISPAPRRGSCDGC